MNGNFSEIGVVAFCNFSPNVRWLFNEIPQFDSTFNLIVAECAANSNLGLLWEIMWLRNAPGTFAAGYLI